MVRVTVGLLTTTVVRGNEEKLLIGKGSSIREILRSIICCTESFKVKVDVSRFKDDGNAVVNVFCTINRKHEQ